MKSSEQTEESVRSRHVEIVRHAAASAGSDDDTVAVEEPLEIRLGDVVLAVVMRTPGDDEDLVRGFCLTEGILLDPTEIHAIEHLDASRLSVRLAEGIEVDATQFQRNMFASSSCGVCGKASIEQVRLFGRPVASWTIEKSIAASLTDRLRDHQPTFDVTGGLHAAGLFDVYGEVIAVREDVGRHNAVDKAIGAATQLHWPLPPCLLAVSGRQSFEVVQKAALAGIGGLVGVSAPSSLAVELARETDMLLVGFSRGEGFNVYAGEDRLAD
jgi:FdhD protein